MVTVAGTWVSKFCVQGTNVHDVSTKESLPATGSGASSAMKLAIQVAGQASNSAPFGHWSLGWPPRQSTLSPSLFSFPTMPSALYFATSKVSESQSSLSRHFTLSLTKQRPGASLFRNGSHTFFDTMVASPFRWLPETGAPSMVTSMHFSSPVKTSTSGGMRPGSIPASLHSKNGGTGGFVLPLVHGRSVGSTKRP